MALVTWNDLNSENLAAIKARAATKQDGCYMLRGIAYKVKSGRVTHFATKGEALENFGNFHFCLGKGDLKTLKSIKD